MDTMCENCHGWFNRSLGFYFGNGFLERCGSMGNGFLEKVGYWGLFGNGFIEKVG